MCLGIVVYETKDLFKAKTYLYSALLLSGQLILRKWKDNMPSLILVMRCLVKQEVRCSILVFGLSSQFGMGVLAHNCWTYFLAAIVLCSRAWEQYFSCIDESLIRKCVHTVHDGGWWKWLRCFWCMWCSFPVMLYLVFFVSICMFYKSWNETTKHPQRI